MPSLFIFILCITYYSYSDGIKGPFIFDDIPNLSPLGQYSALSTWDNFLLFLLEGNSGPTGRPLSLASFYLNDSYWPSQPSGFIRTNILIHLLNGVLVFWFGLKLAKNLNLKRNIAYIFSFIAFSIWILHPMHTTTVLYVIQRMTELSATFIATGLIFYLYGREQLAINIKKGMLILFIGVGGSLFLSVISKENGILLVGYILVIEIFLLQPNKIIPPRYFYHWLIPVIILPFLFIIYYLVQSVLSNSGVFSSRDFNLIERLLTESRILFNYLYHILLPSVGDSTLFHDDYVVSRSIINPWTTLPSVVGIIFLFVSSLILRTRLPIIAFSLAWFLVGHLLESTVIGLELYFEHRNYLPMLGFFLAGAWYIVKATPKIRIPIAVTGVILLALLSFSVMQNASLWGNPKELAAMWYEHHPNSARAQEAYSILVKPLDNESLTKEQLQKNQQFSYMILLDVQRSCAKNEATNKDLESALELLRSVTIQASSVNALRDLMKAWYSNRCKKISQEELISFLARSTSLKSVKKSALYLHMTYYWLYSLYYDRKDLDMVMRSLDQAYQIRPSIGLLLIQARHLASAGLYEEALSRLSNTTVLEMTTRSRLVLKIRLKELNQLRSIIIADMKKISRIKKRKGTKLCL